MAMLYFFQRVFKNKSRDSDNDNESESGASTPRKGDGVDTGTGEEQDRKYHSGALSMRSQGLLSFLEKNRDSFASLGDSVHSSVSSTTTAETTRKSFDLSDIEEHVNDLRTKAVQWTQLSSLFDHRGHCSCVDGREERSVVGMPGGDAGEFLLCLACVETIKGTQLDQEAISKALASRIKVSLIYVYIFIIYIH